VVKKKKEEINEERTKSRSSMGHLIVEISNNNCTFS